MYQGHNGYSILIANQWDNIELKVEAKLRNFKPSSIVHRRNFVFCPWTFCRHLLYFCNSSHSRRKEVEASGNCRCSCQCLRGPKNYSVRSLFTIQILLICNYYARSLLQCAFIVLSSLFSNRFLLMFKACRSEVGRGGKGC